MQQAYVIGLGKSGIAAARVLRRDGWQVTISDRSHSAALQQQQADLAKEKIAVKLGHAFVPTAGIDLLVVSPGVPWDAPMLVQAREQGIEVIGEMELAWRSLSDVPWIGITGTNGKTTTTELVGAIFRAAGLAAPVCGNIGYAACQVALEPRPDWVIAELSSYQIEAAIGPKPQIGVWTTFTPDHLNRHKTLENYFNIKASLLARSEAKVLNGDDPYLRQQVEASWLNTHWTSTQGATAIAPIQPSTYLEGGWVMHQGEAILPATALKMVGAHNQQNLLMAVAAACLAGVPKAAIAAAIENFSGVAHRLEHILIWQGIDFINDSKATNYDAAEVGLRSVKSPAILIAGGEAKGGDDTAWLAQIQQRAARVLLIGSAAAAFAQRLQSVGYEQYEMVETMEKAVLRSQALGPQLGAQVVLLSPACASFDQYPNFERRGDDFRQLCQTYLAS
ncbi:MAG: UDP-N-acetylmuramoyl-L-alanine--D-glutamate ligase [Leptolyngbya sp. SIO4C1]|nr:UDP-N-acetylmuramoyl-L-alanine--D-glutamate ligase [Leptolyngbya sp. SIO4C1]